MTVGKRIIDSTKRDRARPNNTGVASGRGPNVALFPLFADPLENLSNAAPVLCEIRQGPAVGGNVVGVVADPIIGQVPMFDDGIHIIDGRENHFISTGSAWISLAVRVDDLELD